MSEQEQQDIEVWKPVPGWEHYEVSSWGRVRKGDFMMKLRSDPNGLGLELREAGARYGTYVHILVAEAFLRKKKVYHRDGNKQNSRLDNLVEYRPANYVRTSRARPVVERVSKEYLELRNKPEVTWDEIATVLGFKITSYQEAIAHIRANFWDGTDREIYGR